MQCTGQVRLFIHSQILHKNLYFTPQIQYVQLLIRNKAELMPTYTWKEKLFHENNVLLKQTKERI